MSGVRGLLENGSRGRWDKRSKIISWCCGGSQVGRYFSRKIITGLGKVWDISVSVILLYTFSKTCWFEAYGSLVTYLDIFCVC